MRIHLHFYITLFACLLCTALLGADETAAPKAIRAVVVTGGHGFDQNAFPKLFEGLEGVEVAYAPQHDHSELFEDIGDWSYDVIVFYNMTQQISPKRQENFLKLLENGVGVVALHHTMAAFRPWPEFQKIIGGGFNLEPVERDGVTLPKSSYKHDVDFNIHVEDPNHRITEDLTDFTVHDETYKNCVFEPDNHVLLTTDHPTSDRTVAWIRTYRNARVFTVQMGHGPQIFTHPAYQRLVGQAIRFCAGKDRPE